MYKRFYNLQKNPFEITPDPSFLFTTKRHNEALATLYYGVRRHKGFVVMTGEVGTGKTLLIRSLLQLLKLNNVNYAYVFNSKLGPVEFLQYVTGDFRLPVSGKTKSELLLQLSSFVISRFQKGLTTVLVVDEAHHLSTEVLEEIRLLTNLETPEEKLLQILLVGQPELDEKLDAVELRQLKQRIALRSQLQPLDLDETDGYIRRRLQVAGHAQPEIVFPAETVAEIHQHSRGIPRLINTLCENALIQGYANQEATITPRMVEEIALHFRMNVVNSAPVRERTASGEPATDVEQAARTLLDLYASLRKAQSGGAELGSVIRGTRIGKHEPYI
jgi:general secretion pathway protein A